MTPYKLTDETIQYYGRTLYRIEIDIYEGALPLSTCIALREAGIL